MAHGSKYQGYPYVNPRVTDVPSISPNTADKYANLPRKQIYNFPRNNAGTRQQREEESGESRSRPSIVKDEEELPPVVYIDLPNDNGVVSQSRPAESQTQSNNAGVRDSPRPNPSTPKRESVPPVVYIEMPEVGESQLIQNRGTEAASDAGPSRLEDNIDTGDLEFVQETIFYDPFKDRRIDPNVTSSSSARPSRPSRPRPPNTLNISSPGSSGYGTSSTPGPSTFATTPGVPDFMSKETYVYGRQPTPDDGFPLTPIPVTEFPEPPPAYAEIDSVARARPSAAMEQPTPAVTVPPRTQVIVHQDQTSVESIPNSDRKFLHCHHCGFRVHTLVIRETGAVTHVIALSFLMLLLFPLTIAIYCTDYCKYKNHYCPSCNKLIGYEVPVLCQKIVYAK